MLNAMLLGHLCATMAVWIHLEPNVQNQTNREKET
jgi:hypothetical protein